MVKLGVLEAGFRKLGTMGMTMVTSAIPVATALCMSD